MHSTPPKKSPEAAAVGAGRFAVAAHAASRRRLTIPRSPSPLSQPVPLSRSTSQDGGGSAFHAGRHYTSPNITRL